MLELTTIDFRQGTPVEVQWHVDGNRADAKAQLSAIAQRLQRTLGTRHPRTLAIRNLAATDA